MGSPPRWPVGKWWDGTVDEGEAVALSRRDGAVYALGLGLLCMLVEPLLP